MVLVNPPTMIANSNSRGAGLLSRSAASSPVRAAPWLNPKIPSTRGAVRSSSTAQSRVRSQLPGTGPTVSLADLADLDWVHFTPPSGLADVLDAACAGAGFTPRAAVRTQQAPSALNLARAGLGVTLLPGNVVPPSFDGVLRRPDPPVQRMLSTYTRVRPDPINAAFVEAISHNTLATPAHILSLQ
jgi:hypothetical protein